MQPMHMHFVRVSVWGLQKVSYKSQKIMFNRNCDENSAMGHKQSVLNYLELKAAAAQVYYGLAT